MHPNVLRRNVWRPTSLLENVVLNIFMMESLGEDGIQPRSDNRIIIEEVDIVARRGKGSSLWAEQRGWVAVKIRGKLVSLYVHVMFELFVVAPVVTFRPFCYYHNGD